MSTQKMQVPAFTIAKTEPDKMLVFGWSNVAVDADGNQIEDLQGDVIDPDELEKAAYDHVLRFRATGEKHDPGLRHKGRLVESCVFTKEKQAAIGIPPGIVPEGWWVGYKIDDPDAWAKIKSGEYQSFSIGGKGERTPIEKARGDYDQYPGYNEWLEENLDATEEERKAAEKHYKENNGGNLAKSYAELRKANPYHDELGRFASKPGGGGATAAGFLSGHRAENGYDLMDDEKASLVRQDTGMSEEEAQEVISAINDYTVEGYQRIREAQVAGWPEDAADQADTIEKYIDAAPKYGEGDLYRGMSVPDDFAGSIHVGDVIDNGGALSSWSSNENVAENFTAHGPWGEKGAVLVIEGGTKRGTSIKHLSANGRDEDEVLIPASAQYEITDIFDGDTVYVYLKEVS